MPATAIESDSPPQAQEESAPEPAPQRTKAPAEPVEEAAAEVVEAAAPPRLTPTPKTEMNATAGGDGDSKQPPAAEAPE